MQSAIAWRVLASQSLASRLKRQVRSPPIYFQYGNPPPRWDPPDRVDEFMSGRPPLGCGDLPPPRGLGIWVEELAEVFWSGVSMRNWAGAALLLGDGLDPNVGQQ